MLNVGKHKDQTNICYITVFSVSLYTGFFCNSKGMGVLGWGSLSP